MCIFKTYISSKLYSQWIIVQIISTNARVIIQNGILIKQQQQQQQQQLFFTEVCCSGHTYIEWVFEQFSVLIYFFEPSNNDIENT